MSLFSRARRRMAPLFAASLVGIAMSVGAADTPVANATSITHTVTISGVCDGSGGVTSDWQTVTGMDPEGSTPARFGVGDSLKIVNNCDLAQNDFDNLHLVNQGYGFPALSADPSFSDGTQWTINDSNFFNRSYGKVVRGQSVTITLVAVGNNFDLAAILIGGWSPAAGGVFASMAYGRFDVTLVPRITPMTQTVTGQVSSAITPTSAFTPSNISGAVTYAVTGANQLPAGLALDPTLGVITGTPSAVSTDTVTITATGATSGTATATVTFAISSAPTTTTTTTTTVAVNTTTATTTTTVAVNTTTATTTTVAVNTSSTPTLVTSSNQAALTSRPGSATILINGTAVTPEVVSVAESVAAQVPPTQRTAAQISQLQDAAQQITQQLDTIAGGDSGVNVINTSTGAVLTGVFEGQRVPVEDVVVVQAQQTATLFAARDSRGNIVEVQPGAVLEVNADGDVAVQAFGLPAGESVELVLMSTPTLLGSFVVDAKGTVKTTADVPASIGAGNHTLVVATPSIQASLGLKVVKPISQLPNTGSSLTLVNWGVAVALLGAYLVLVSNTRRRRFQI